MYVNKVILIGNLGQDPELNYAQDSTAVCNFSVATSEKWKDRQTGERKERTEWHRVVAWKALAESCGKYLAKVSKVYIEGKLQTRSWERDGVTHYTTEVVANDVQFLSPKNDGACGGSGRSTRSSSNGRNSDRRF